MQSFKSYPQEVLYDHNIIQNKFRIFCIVFMTCESPKVNEGFIFYREKCRTGVGRGGALVVESMHFDGFESTGSMHFTGSNPALAAT